MFMQVQTHGKLFYRRDLGKTYLEVHPSLQSTDRRRTVDCVANLGVMKASVIQEMNALKQRIRSLEPDKFQKRKGIDL